MTKPTLLELKSLPHILKMAPTSQNRPFSMIEGGISCGGIVELAGPQGGGKTEFALRFLRENPDLPTAWIEPDWLINPYAIAEIGLDLEQILFVQPARQAAVSVVHTVIRSQVYPLIVLSHFEELDELSLRKMQLAAQKSKVTLFLIQNHFSKNHWAISQQIYVERNPTVGRIQIKLVKGKGNNSCVNAMLA